MTDIDQIDPKKNIVIKGARVNNLQNLSVAIPRNKLIVITGVSGSGKSSLAFDTLFAEGQRMYVESLSSYARQFLGRMEKPEVDYIKGVSPAIAIEQKVGSKNPRSTVVTTTEIYDYFKLIFAINISTKPLTKTSAAVEKLAGRISAQIRRTGIKIYHITPLNSPKKSLCLLSCLAVYKIIESFAISDG